MALLDLFKKSAPKTANANTKGIDKTPIGIEEPFKPSKDLMKSDLSKPRHGQIGQKYGYTSIKPYSSSNTKK